MANLVQVPGIEKTSAAFRDKVIHIAAEIGTDPNFLMAIMSFESGGTFSPSIKSLAGSGATGLIQFMPKTAIGLGTTTAALAQMTAEDQLDFVRKYFMQFKGKLKTLEDAYMAVLFPAAINKGAGHVLFKKGTIQYKQNSGLDANGDGLVTVAEAARKVRERLGTETLPTTLQPTDKFLQHGSTGPAVEMLQNELIDLGYLTSTDFKTGPGIFGPRTDAAVKAFQKDIGLNENGIYDLATQAAIRQINEGVKKGVTGGVVAALQQHLVAEKLLTEEDVATGPGIFGPKTQNALIKFQMQAGLEPNGELTDETYRGLFRKEMPVPETIIPMGDNVAINTILPVDGDGFKTYNREPGGVDQVGTQLTINALISLGAAWFMQHPEIPIQYGDISRKGGGKFPPHSAHKNGREVDIRPMRKDKLLQATNIHDPSYDPAMTKTLVKFIRQKFTGVTILFNDPKLVSEGLTKPHAQHDNHLHLKFP
jgi:peptidoglycan hydrolase-like protein with peptidoglycan-binding domain